VSERTVQLLEAFESLAAGEKQDFAIEVLRRTRELPFDSGPLADEEIAEAGKALAAFLEHDENAPRRR
jgi:hypothetical protein